MVITKDTKLPTIEELETREVNCSTATLMAAAPYIGKFCENINNEFMLCRQETGDARACYQLGKVVTSCTMQLLQRVKADCLHEFNQYANCVDKSSTDYKPWPCRKTQAVFDHCMKDKLGLERPHWGHFTRARVHNSGCTAPPPPKPCPCHPSVQDATPSLPDCKERKPPRFGSRFYWMTE